VHGDRREDRADHSCRDEAGASDYVTKPFQEEELLGSIRGRLSSGSAGLQRIAPARLRSATASDASHLLVGGDLGWRATLASAGASWRVRNGVDPHRRSDRGIQVSPDLRGPGRRALVGRGDSLPRALHAQLQRASARRDDDAYLDDATPRLENLNIESSCSHRSIRSAREPDRGRGRTTRRDPGPGCGSAIL